MDKNKCPIFKWLWTFEIEKMKKVKKTTCDDNALVLKKSIKYL
jgi:hypothetical protein